MWRALNSGQGTYFIEMTRTEAKKMTLGGSGQRLLLCRQNWRWEYHIGGNSSSRCSKIRKYTLGEGRAFRKMYYILKLEET